MSIVRNLLEAFTGVFSINQAYQVNPSVNKESVRARIYENIGKEFERIGKGLYITKEHNCVLIEGDGRDLSFLEDSSIDCIITDHPWLDKKANKGGDRNFAKYECFTYTLEDFQNKSRVLKEGCFLVECIPAENESNFDYLYQLKKMAQEAGFEYYAKVPWIKGTFVSNTGRNAKNFEDLMIFSKGKARSLRIDAKKTKQLGIESFMSGTNKMLPTAFNVQAISNKNRIAQSEKPQQLFEELLEYITKENEIVLDQFAGSGSVGAACLAKHRPCIVIEKSHELVNKICERIGLESISHLAVA